MSGRVLTMECVTNWATTPQAVGNSQWQSPLPSELPDSDLVNVGGDLEPSTIINAYRRGIFPMETASLPGVVGWWSPDPRGVLSLDGLRISRSLHQSAKRYEIRV